MPKDLINQKVEWSGRVDAIASRVREIIKEITNSTNEEIQDIERRLETMEKSIHEIKDFMSIILRKLDDK